MQQVMVFSGVCVCVCVCLCACKTQEEVSSLREQVSADSAVLIDLQKAMQEQSQGHSRASHSIPSSTPSPPCICLPVSFSGPVPLLLTFPGHLFVFLVSFFRGINALLSRKKPAHTRRPVNS
jgi:hypothetical protein